MFSVMEDITFILALDFWQCVLETIFLPLSLFKMIYEDDDATVFKLTVCILLEIFKGLID